MKTPCSLLLTSLLLSTAGAHGAMIQQAYLKASSIWPGDNFGYAVSLSGDTLVIGARFENAGSGGARVFVRDGTTWIEQAHLTASNPGPDDNFGFSVAVSGDTVVVGAPFEDSDATGVQPDGGNENTPNSGAAYVFVRQGTVWTQQACLKASNTDWMDQFGVSVAVSGDTIVVGANREDCASTGVNGVEDGDGAVDSGAAYVFGRAGTNWTQQAYLKASNTEAGDQFGWPVVVWGDTIVIGAKAEDSNAVGVNGDQNDNSATDSGAAYVFVRAGTNWTQQAYLKASNTGADDEFGQQLAVSGDTLVVGAWFEDSRARGVNGDETDNSVSDSGAAYVFVRAGTNWSQQAYLKASNTLSNNDRFGRSVAASGDTVVIGATREDSDATGVNGDPFNKRANEAGAAYVFVRSGIQWTQQAYLKASNTEAGDTFGVAVAAWGATVAVGAVFEDSGVNGDPSNNSATDAGAAYVFTGFGIGPRLDISQDDTGGYFIRVNGFPGYSYELQRATSLDSSWSTIDNSIAPLSGLIEFQDTNPTNAQTFYRVVAK